ncbi:MAG TPA: hypothetical protein V6C78_00795 [Crinalium sp.]|jgi:hypothetical protein
MVLSPRTTTTSTTDFYFGVVFELSGKQIKLEPLTPINRIKQTGLECEIDEPVNLGEIGENLKDLLDTLGADPDTIFVEGTTQIKPEIKDLPVVGEIVETLLEANITIEQFHLKIPPKPALAPTPTPTPPPTPTPTPATASTPTRYTVGMSAVWDVEAGKGRLFGNVFLRGLYLKVSNEGLPPPPALPSTPTPTPTP